MKRTIQQLGSGANSYIIPLVTALALTEGLGDARRERAKGVCSKPLRPGRAWKHKRRRNKR